MRSSGGRSRNLKGRALVACDCSVEDIASSSDWQERSEQKRVRKNCKPRLEVSESKGVIGQDLGWVSLSKNNGQVDVGEAACKSRLNTTSKGERGDMNLGSASRQNLSHHRSCRILNKKSVFLLHATPSVWHSLSLDILLWAWCSLTFSTAREKRSCTWSIAVSIAICTAPTKNMFFKTTSAGSYHPPAPKSTARWAIVGRPRASCIFSMGSMNAWWAWLKPGSSWSMGVMVSEWADTISWVRTRKSSLLRVMARKMSLIATPSATAMMTSRFWTFSSFYAKNLRCWWSLWAPMPRQKPLMAAAMSICGATQERPRFTVRPRLFLVTTLIRWRVLRLISRSSCSVKSRGRGRARFNLGFLRRSAFCA